MLKRDHSLRIQSKRMKIRPDYFGSAQRGLEQMQMQCTIYYHNTIISQWKFYSNKSLTSFVVIFVLHILEWRTKTASVSTKLRCMHCKDLRISVVFLVKCYFFNFSVDNLQRNETMTFRISRKKIIFSDKSSQSA